MCDLHSSRSTVTFNSVVEYVRDFTVAKIVAFLVCLAADITDIRPNAHNIVSNGCLFVQSACLSLTEFLPHFWNGEHVKTRVVVVTTQSCSSARRNVCFPRRLRPSGCYGTLTPGVFLTPPPPNICSTALHYRPTCRCFLGI